METYFIKDISMSGIQERLNAFFETHPFATPVTGTCVIARDGFYEYLLIYKN